MSRQKTDSFIRRLTTTPLKYIPLLLLGFFLALVPAATGQQAYLQPAEPQFMPGETDGNCPSFWWNGRYCLFTSIGRPLKLNIWLEEYETWETLDVDVTTLQDLAIWVESVWVDDDGTLFGWYHHEPGEMYPDSQLTAPKIGAIISYDGGRTIHDLGFILETGDPLEPDARNGAFTGGHGDFSVILDQEREFFYFHFTNYNGPEESQGIVTARMAFADRFAPQDRVFKYHEGSWTEPGRGGRMTPIFRADRAWRHEDPDSLWGPAVHWNTYLERHVMLLNRTYGQPGWSQEGIYIAYSTDLSRPEDWSEPDKIMGSSALPHWGLFYPQALGLDAGNTDTTVGHVARFYLNGGSLWEIVFVHEDGWRPSARSQH